MGVALTDALPSRFSHMGTAAGRGWSRPVRTTPTEPEANLQPYIQSFSGTKKSLRLLRIIGTEAEPCCIITV